MVEVAMTNRCQKERSLKGTVKAVLAGGALLLAASDQALASGDAPDASTVQKVREAGRAEAIVPLSWGESNSGTSAAGEEEAQAREEGPTESRPIDRPSPKLM
jgi:hypothetical protein